MAALNVKCGDVDNMADLTSTGDGTLTSLYKISTLDGLELIRHGSNCAYEMTANIDATDTSTWNSGAGWMPFSFGGRLDAKGHSISNLTVNRPSTQYIGFLSNLYSNEYLPISLPIISNLKLQNISVTASGNYATKPGDDIVESLHNLEKSS